jgi:hypothetical protein
MPKRRSQKSIVSTLPPDYSQTCSFALYGHLNVRCHSVFLLSTLVERAASDFKHTEYGDYRPPSHFGNNEPSYCRI